MPSQLRAQISTSTSESASATTATMIERLRADGHRVTTARRAVIDALARSDAHPSVDELSADVESRIPGLHLSTIYRTVETLVELGLVTHVHLGHGKTAYHLVTAAPDAEHVHAQCRSCGRILDLPHGILDPVRDELHTTAGFTLDPHHVALSGVCKDCDVS